MTGGRWPGVRVLDLTRVLAGPVATRVLAGLGAAVLRLDQPGWDEPGLVPEVTVGKRCARLDLRAPDGRGRLEELFTEADVVVHSLRPGALERAGFAQPRRERLRPGVIDVSLTAYGESGPWAHRRGFDSVVQLTSGLAAEGPPADVAPPHRRRCRCRRSTTPRAGCWRRRRYARSPSAGEAGAEPGSAPRSPASRARRRAGRDRRGRGRVRSRLRSQQRRSRTDRLGTGPGDGPTVRRDRPTADHPPLRARSRGAGPRRADLADWVVIAAYRARSREGLDRSLRGTE